MSQMTVETKRHLADLLEALSRAKTARESVRLADEIKRVVEPSLDGGSNGNGKTNGAH